MPDANETPLVLQSYRRHDVAPWIERCMRGVRGWAAGAGHDYEFVDDALFDLLPGWFREQCGHAILPQTDLARLLLMRERLAQGRTRVIWLDADVHVFAPRRLAMNNGARYGVCTEHWYKLDDAGQPVTRARLNNAAMFMVRGNAVLDFLIHACLEQARAMPAGGISKLAFGPRLLTALGAVVPLRQVREVGMLSPAVMQALLAGEQGPLRLLTRLHGVPLAAANLCASLVGRDGAGHAIDNAQMMRAMDLLEAFGDETTADTPAQR